MLAVTQAVYVLLGFGAGLIAVGGLARLLREVRDAVVVLLGGAPGHRLHVRLSKPAFQRLVCLGVFAIGALLLAC